MFTLFYWHVCRFTILQKVLWVFLIFNTLPQDSPSDGRTLNCDQLSDKNYQTHSRKQAKVTILHTLQKKPDAIIPNKFQIIIFLFCFSRDYNVYHLYMWCHFPCQAHQINAVQSFLIVMWNLPVLYNKCYIAILKLC